MYAKKNQHYNILWLSLMHKTWWDANLCVPCVYNKYYLLLMLFIAILTCLLTKFLFLMIISCDFEPKKSGNTASMRASLPTYSILANHLGVYLIGELRKRRELSLERIWTVPFWAWGLKNTGNEKMKFEMENENSKIENKNSTVWF